MSSPFNVLLLGAGPINFGTTEGPWNHSKRLEKILGSRLKIVGIVDLSAERAANVLAIKAADDSIKAGYADTQIFKSLEEAVSKLDPESQPSLIIDGLPPVARGSTIPGRDNELRMLKLFPDAAFLIEKPISSAGVDQVEEVKLALKGRVVSVGYMLRYLKAVQRIKKHIEENELTVMLTLARYFLAYSYAAELFSKKMTGYWDKTTELGPVISQGTHLVDLVRYLSPPALPETMHVSTVEHDDPAGRLSLLVGEDEVISPEKRIPRVTNAVWSTEVGGTVNFVHGIALHEGDYDCEVVILADGWKFTLQDPYSSAPRLLIRRPGQAEEVQTVFTNDDCYETELAALIDVIEGRAERDAILSPYEDAFETYKLTWDITLKGEATRKTRSRRA